MKKLFAMMAVAALMTACNNGSESKETKADSTAPAATMTTDTTAKPAMDTTKAATDTTKK